jgi:hypothetical protein
MASRTPEADSIRTATRETNDAREERPFRTDGRTASRGAGRLFQGGRPEHNNPATVEEFAREQMGIAAKE